MQGLWVGSGSLHCGGLCRWGCWGPPSFNLPHSEETTQTWPGPPSLLFSEDAVLSLSTSLVYTAPQPGHPSPSSPHCAHLALLSTFKVTAPWKPFLITVPMCWPTPTSDGEPRVPGLLWSPVASNTGFRAAGECQKRQLSSKHTSAPMKGTANKVSTHLCATASASDPVLIRRSCI